MAYQNIRKITDDNRSGYVDPGGSFAIYALERILKLGIDVEPSLEMGSIYFQNIKLKIPKYKLAASVKLYRTEIMKHYKKHLISLVELIAKSVFQAPQSSDCSQSPNNIVPSLFVRKELFPRYQTLRDSICSGSDPRVINIAVRSTIEGLFGSSKTLYYYDQPMKQESVVDEWKTNDHSTVIRFVELPRNVINIMGDFLLFLSNASSSNYPTQYKDLTGKVNFELQIKLLLSLLYGKQEKDRLAGCDYDLRQITSSPDEATFKSMLSSLGWGGLTHTVNSWIDIPEATAIIMSPFAHYSDLTREPYANNDTNRIVVKQTRGILEDNGKLLYMAIWVLLNRLQFDGSHDCCGSVKTDPPLFGLES